MESKHSVKKSRSQQVPSNSNIGESNKKHETSVATSEILQDQVKDEVTADQNGDSHHADEKVDETEQKKSGKAVLKGTTKSSTSSKSKQTNSSSRPAIRKSLSINSDKGTKLKKTAQTASFDNDSTTSPAQPLSGRRSSSEISQRPSSSLSRIALQDASVDDIVTKHGNQSFVMSGFNLINFKSTKKTTIKSSQNTNALEAFFKSTIYMNLLLHGEKTTINNNKTTSEPDALSQLCQMIMNQTMENNTIGVNSVLEAGRQASKLLRRNLIFDMVDVNHVIKADNRFSLYGMVDCILAGKDFHGNKTKDLVLVKLTSEKFVPSQFVLELFLYAGIMDVETAYILLFHSKESLLALYQFKFKFDHLREFNRGTTRKLLCENFYKNVYQNHDFKLVIKERKDIKHQTAQS